MHNKNFKILFTVLLVIIILQTFSFIYLKLFYFPAYAAADWTIPDLQVKIFDNKTFSPLSCTTDANGAKTCSSIWIAEYISWIYKYAIGVIGILATVVMMIGGIMWIVAGGNAGRITEAKAWIGASVTGLILALCSYTILWQINPDLVKFDPLSIQVVEAFAIDKEAEQASRQKIKLSTEKYCGCVNWKSLYNTTSLNNPESIANAIRSLNSSSPLINYSQKIYDLSRQYGIDPALIIGKSVVENALATVNAKIITQRKNIGSITCQCGSNGGNWFCDQTKNSYGLCFRNYSNYNDSLEDYFKVMSKPGGILAKTNTVREMIAKYAPPSQNDTQGYINTVMSIVSKYHTELSSDKGVSCDCYSF